VSSAQSPHSPFPFRCSIFFNIQWTVFPKKCYKKLGASLIHDKVGIGVQLIRDDGENAVHSYHHLKFYSFPFLSCDHSLLQYMSGYFFLRWVFNDILSMENI
jgi:hypothetical protein